MSRDTSSSENCNESRSAAYGPHPHHVRITSHSPHPLPRSCDIQVLWSTARIPFPAPAKFKCSGVLYSETSTAKAVGEENKTLVLQSPSMAGRTRGRQPPPGTRTRSGSGGRERITYPGSEWWMRGGRDRRERRMGFDMDLSNPIRRGCGEEGTDASAARRSSRSAAGQSPPLAAATSRSSSPRYQRTRCRPRRARAGGLQWDGAERLRAGGAAPSDCAHPVRAPTR
jgi:hypothetical protein